jgi:phospholipid/cholesterol/gamma-HCH transport system permease protein
VTGSTTGSTTGEVVKAGKPAALPPWSMGWIVTTAAVGAAVLRQMIRPVTWRRTVRMEFMRFMAISGLQSIPAVTVTAVLAGLGLLSQALYWLEQVGQNEEITQIILTILVREVAPLTVGLLAIGRSGLIILSELSRMREEGRLRALDAQGLDPLLLLVLPRVLALSLSTFCLTILFVTVAPLAGMLAALALGITRQPVDQILLNILGIIGSAGYAILPLKSLGIGFMVGLATCVTALEHSASRDEAATTLLPAGFFRALLLTLVVNGLLSMMV